MKKVITAAALSAALLAGAGATAGALYKDVQLSVDGELQRSTGFALTVADVLAARGVVVNEGDVVTPGLDESLTSGDLITVQYRKELTLQVDGEAKTFLTTAATLDEALNSSTAAEDSTRLLASSQLPDLEGARFNAPLSTQLPREGLEVAVSTPKKIKLKVGGEATQVTTTAPTVADLLTEQDLSVDSNDRLTPEATAPIEADTTVVLDRVKIKESTKTEKVAYKTVKKSDSKLWKGESKTLTAGVNGKAVRTYKTTIVNGKVAEKVVTKEVIKQKAKNEVVAVGTKKSANGIGINLARAGMWDKIARCESGGNWKINTGNGYYGGLQFSLASWRSNGGRDFAARPDQASRAQQITVANRYYAKAGTSPWSCA